MKNIILYLFLGLVLVLDCSIVYGGRLHLNDYTAAKKVSSEKVTEARSNEKQIRNTAKTIITPVVAPILKFYTTTGDGSYSMASKDLGPFNSCNEMFSHCEKRCGAKSNENNRWGILALGQSHKEKCIDLCQSEGTSCESGIDNKFVIRAGYCEAVCIGSSESYECEKRCKKDADFWKF